MKQNTFWLVAGLFLIIVIEGFFVVHAGNKVPGAFVMATSLIGLILSISISNK